MVLNKRLLSETQNLFTDVPRQMLVKIQSSNCSKSGVGSLKAEARGGAWMQVGSVQRIRPRDPSCLASGNTKAEDVLYAYKSLKPCMFASYYSRHGL